MKTLSPLLITIAFTCCLATSATAFTPPMVCSLMPQGLNPNPIVAGLPSTNSLEQMEQYFNLACANEYPQYNCLTPALPQYVGPDGVIYGVQWNSYEQGCGILTIVTPNNFH